MSDESVDTKHLHDSPAPGETDPERVVSFITGKALGDRVSMRPGNCEVSVLPSQCSEAVPKLSRRSKFGPNWIISGRAWDGFGWLWPELDQVWSMLVWFVPGLGQICRGSRRF